MLGVKLGASGGQVPLLHLQGQARGGALRRCQEVSVYGVHRIPDDTRRFLQGMVVTEREQFLHLGWGRSSQGGL